MELCALGEGRKEVETVVVRGTVCTGGHNIPEVGKRAFLKGENHGIIKGFASYLACNHN